jgi:hypothetical protein
MVKEYVVAIYDDEINIVQGPNLYECFLPDEFGSDEALVESFATRLRRLLSGGDWATPTPAARR